MRDDVCFSTWCKDPIHDRDQMIRSVKYFHPDIPFEALDGKWIDCFLDSHPELKLYGAYGHIAKMMLEKYKRIIHIDCDVILTAPIDDAIDGDFEIGVARNNNDFGLSGGNPPIAINGICGVNNYLNAGFHVITNPEVCADWIREGEKGNYTFPYAEQYTLNKVFYSGKYKTKLFDPIDSNEYWNLATSWNIGLGDYSSWKLIKMRGNTLTLNGKEVKMLHRAGGGVPGLDNKFSKDMFSGEVWERLMEITA